MKRRLSLAAAALAAWGTFAPAQVQDYLETEWLLSNEDFYRLVSCRALPGGPCTAEPVRWPANKAQDLSVGIAEIPPGYPDASSDRVEGAIDARIAETVAYRWRFRREVAAEVSMRTLTK